MKECKIVRIALAAELAERTFCCSILTADRKRLYVFPFEASWKYGAPRFAEISIIAGVCNVVRASSLSASHTISSFVI